MADIEKIRIYELADEQTTITDSDVGVLDKAGYPKAKRYTFANLATYIQSKLTLVAAFLQLSDVPASYTGAAGKVVAVNGTEDALEFIDPPAGDNMANADLTLTANRNHDLDVRELNFKNGKWVSVENCFWVKAQADTLAENVFYVTKNDGITKTVDVRGNGLIALGGIPINSNYTVTVNGSVGDSGGLYIPRVGGGIPIYASGGSYNLADSFSVAGWFGDTTSATGIWGRATTGTGVKAETTSTGLALEVIGKCKITGLNTYADNATASAALGGAGYLYIRTGHGLDITV